MAKKTTKPKERISKVTGKPVQKRNYTKKTGAPKGNKNNEKYPIEVALELFEKAKDILNNNSGIITETELMIKCKYELSLPMSSYRYLRDEKYKVDLADIKNEINSLLETRVMKSKDMYPGIAAMTLKNKHGWRDEKQLDVSANFKVEIIDHFEDNKNPA